MVAVRFRMYGWVVTRFPMPDWFGGRFQLHLTGQARATTIVEVEWLAIAVTIRSSIAGGKRPALIGFLLRRSNSGSLRVDVAVDWEIVVGRQIRSGELSRVRLGDSRLTIPMVAAGVGLETRISLL